MWIEKERYWHYLSLETGSSGIVSLKHYKCMEKVNMHEILLRKSFAKTCLTMKFILLFLLAFVAQLSAGVYGYPKREAIRIALEELSRASLDATLCCYTEADRMMAEGILQEMDQPS